MTLKIIYNPVGDPETHTFANAFDLCAHAGYTTFPTRKESAAPSDAAPTDEEDDSGDADLKGGDADADEAPPVVETEEGAADVDPAVEPEAEIVAPEAPEAPAVERPDFAAWTKDQLEDYARKNYAVEIDRRKSQATLATLLGTMFDEHNAS